ncbi:GTPase [Mycobacterium sp. ENV421]|uniref:GTPase n=1 Tax=Mycobacterium sp. ENV421 TaxID=1213407 RepID=UPI001304AE29|nr:GTPase [Mycobacterium sp. ENV421]
MDLLDELGEAAIGAYAILLPTADGLGPLAREVSEAKEVFAEKVRRHLSEQRDVLSTFNVVFFGRTGAGKSTLMSAFGGLDGRDVSPGDSDWTTKVRSVDWRGCRLYDTPGINGWGRRKSRAELEATAQRAVEIADVVLLCFDSQSQQASEFSKVADWVRHYGKPTIAVLNIRNLRWRHPAKVPNQTARQNISEPVRQHSDNIRTELASIGLPETPVVAIHSRRALFARASTPFRGPAERDFLNEREQHGVDYLARWSNFGTLESLLTSGIAAGGAQLRLTSLREGMRAILQDEAGMLKALGLRLGERIDEVDRAISRHLDVLGYLESDERATYLHDDEWSGDLLTIAETARGAPYLMPADGTFSRYLRMLLKPHLSVPRSEALKRFKRLERKAFDDHQDVDEETFVSTVFDEPAIAAALEAVWTESAAFLERELSMAAAELRRSDFSAERDSSDLAGAAGSASQAFEAAFRATGLLTGVTAAVGVIALANAWNPIGWAGGIVVAGISIASSVLGIVGSRHGDSAERQRAEARAKAAYAGRTAIRTTFDGIEKDFAVNARSVAWREAAPSVKSLLRESVVLTRLREQAASIAEQLDEKASKIATTPRVDALEGALQTLLNDDASADGRDHRHVVQRILLGEDWFDVAITPDEVNATGNRVFVEACRARHDADVHELRRALSRALVHPDIARVADWVQLLADAAKRDAAFRPALVAATPPRGARPSVAVAGDFSAGKSSFIKRLLVEMEGEVPETLHIRADPTTDDVHVYQLGSVDLVDTPGFQSGRSGHDDKAVSATTNAALVIVLLHVNLLIGDTARLEGVVKGTEAAPGKWPRMLFLINRCDELGVDPLHGVGEYFNRRDRKATELHAALASRGIYIERNHIHGIAADPFSAVGSSLPVTRAAYNANREWDGIGAFLEALRSLSPSEITQANAVAALDNAVAELVLLNTETRTECEANRAEADKHGAVIKALDECLDDAQHLSETLEHTLSEAVSRHTTNAISKIREVDRGDDEKLAKALTSWNNPDLQAEIDVFLTAATDQIGEWAAAHASAINRELAAANFDQKMGRPVAEGEETPRDTVGDVLGVGEFLTVSVQKLATGAGTRDAAYAIGKGLGKNFKPWGAVKLGQTVARAGMVLQVAAVAWDAVSWVRTEAKRSDWDETINAAVESVEQNAADNIAEFLRGENAPIAYLEKRIDEVAAFRDDHKNQQMLANFELSRTDRRLSAVSALLDAFDNLRKEPGSL